MRSLASISCTESVLEDLGVRHPCGGLVGGQPLVEDLDRRSCLQVVGDRAPARSLPLLEEKAIGSLLSSWWAQLQGLRQERPMRVVRGNRQSGRDRRKGISNRIPWLHLINSVE